MSAAAGPGADGAVAATVGADCGRLWPRPTQLEMAEGDAVLVHWATPHAAVRPLPCSQALVPQLGRRVKPGVTVFNRLFQ